MSIIPELSHSIELSLSSLLELIDTKLSKLGRKAWENTAFGTTYKLSDDLLEYREILIQKMKGCDCYEDTSLEHIISKIKTLTH